MKKKLLTAILLMASVALQAQTPKITKFQKIVPADNDRADTTKVDIKYDQENRISEFMETVISPQNSYIDTARYLTSLDYQDNQITVVKKQVYVNRKDNELFRQVFTLNDGLVAKETRSGAEESTITFTYDDDKQLKLAQYEAPNEDPDIYYWYWTDGNLNHIDEGDDSFNYSYYGYNYTDETADAWVNALSTPLQQLYCNNGYDYWFLVAGGFFGKNSQKLMNSYELALYDEDGETPLPGEITTAVYERDTENNRISAFSNEFVSYQLFWNDAVTGIRNVKTDHGRLTYSLSGIRQMHPGKGISIVGNKKIIK